MRRTLITDYTFSLKNVLLLSNRPGPCFFSVFFFFFRTHTNTQAYDLVSISDTVYDFIFKTVDPRLKQNSIPFSDLHRVWRWKSLDSRPSAGMQAARNFMMRCLIDRNIKWASKLVGVLIYNFPHRRIFLKMFVMFVFLEIRSVWYRILGQSAAEDT